MLALPTPQRFPDTHLHPSATPSPQPTRSFRATKGGDFGFVHPTPGPFKGLLTEEAACEDFASSLNLVPERSLLCVWTQDSHAQGKSVLMPYTAVSHIDIEVGAGPLLLLLLLLA